MIPENYMQRAINLAKLGAGNVSPNPMVGAVIVHQGRIIGEGYHQQYGQAHAEVNAINAVLKKYPDAITLLQQSTLYVSLEPCSHYGKTPPCALLIIKHKIPKVVIGCTDPNPRVSGKGIELLKNTGTEVSVGVLEKECMALNKRFFTSITKQRPYIILKWAQTADGFFAPANGVQHWITSAPAKTLVHKWRTQEDCILVGTHTAKIDNPQLNVRLVAGRNPKRAFIDRDLSLPKDFFLLDNSQKTFVFNCKKTTTQGNTKYIAIEEFDYLLPQYILYQLYLNDVQSLIIEGGAKTLQTFIDAGLWDEARVFTSAKNLSTGIKVPHIKGNTVSVDSIGGDTLKIINPLWD
ncbi:MAG: bifunctional diaminohydroxyphosphoribosylaminopyrimidine deaminase/5-amino-6-(5-phosphoribosylamino)uracil reductase RibD [Sphingobacteriales bacterium]|nr:MAG: bifunctional diaminohydroxyphosphoribosylaminopyrimidine deaminase/5-amino-6-(5-phosphoribosylamino)uracil reductase RibD [Sphingobacteriales bacterium]